jgi:hypothetical protein
MYFLCKRMSSVKVPARGHFGYAKYKFIMQKYYFRAQSTLFQIWNEQCISINIHTYPEEKQKI